MSDRVLNDLRALVERLSEFPSCPDPLVLAVLVAEANLCLDKHDLRTYSRQTPEQRGRAAWARHRRDGGVLTLNLKREP
jgi:hypothetical protein